MKQRTVLVTGASGFIGSSFMRMFGSVAHKIGYRIISLVRKPTGLPDEIVLDLCDKNLSSKLRKIHSVDTIVHLGAMVDFNASLEELYTPNALATAILAVHARETGAHLIFASTVTVHGVHRAVIKRDTPIKQDTDYARSKRMAERAIEATAPEHLILRISGVYGNNGSQHLGINKAIAQAQKGVAPTLYGSGQGIRNYIYVVDLVKMMILALKQKTTGIHLVAGADRITIATMLEQICDVFLPGTELVRRDGPPGCDQVVEPSKEFCWSHRTFKEALTHMKLWHERIR